LDPAARKAGLQAATDKIVVKQSASRKFDLAIMAIRFSIATYDWLFGLFGYLGLLRLK